MKLRCCKDLMQPQCWGWEQPRDLCPCQFPFFLPIFAGLLGVSPHPIFCFYYYSVAQSG